MKEFSHFSRPRAHCFAHYKRSVRPFGRQSCDGGRPGGAPETDRQRTVGLVAHVIGWCTAPDTYHMQGASEEDNAARAAEDERQRLDVAARAALADAETRLRIEQATAAKERTRLRAQITALRGVVLVWPPDGKVRGGRGREGP